MSERIHHFGWVHGLGGAGRGLTLLEFTRPQHYFVLVGRCLEQLDSGLVSNHQHVLAQSALGQPYCWARNPRRRRLLAVIEARLPSSIIPGLQINPGPAGGPGLWTAPSGNDRLESRRMRAHRQSVGDSHIHVGLRLRHHSEKLSPLLSES